jgi:hypothetical protein
VNYATVKTSSEYVNSLFTNATVVEDAIRFVSSNISKDKEKMKTFSNSSNDDGDESKEPDYDNYGEKSDDKQGEEKQEWEHQVPRL